MEKDKGRGKTKKRVRFGRQVSWSSGRPLPQRPVAEAQHRSTFWMFTGRTGELGTREKGKAPGKKGGGQALEASAQAGIRLLRRQWEKQTGGTHPKRITEKSPKNTMTVA